MSDGRLEAFAEPGEQEGNEARRAEQARQLLDGIRLHATRVRAARVAMTRALLEHPMIRDHLTRRRLRRQLTAERFNVFDALWIDRREIYHSRFLAYLLDPRQSHDQGAVFLKAVVGFIGRKMQGAESAEWIESLDYASCRVTAEQHAEEYGRIDLVLEFRCGTRIGIENKVDHLEGERQLPRYREWLDRCGANRGHQVLVFLTPDGRKSVENCGKYVRLSYRDVADALTEASGECSSSAVPLLSTLQQYIQLCRRLAEGGNEVADQSKEILDILRDPERLAVALDVEMHLAVVKEEVKAKFRSRVVDLLNESLRETPGSGLWIAGQKQVWGNSYVCIRTIRDRQGEANSNYSCGVYLKFSGQIEGGWHRPAELRMWPSDRDTQGLEERMKGEGIGVPRSWWVSWANPSEDGIPHLVWSIPDDIVAIQRDNLGEGGLDLAEKVAAWIWERFKNYRGDIEKLKSFELAEGQASQDVGQG